MVILDNIPRYILDAKLWMPVQSIPKIPFQKL